MMIKKNDVKEEKRQKNMQKKYIKIIEKNCDQ